MSASVGLRERRRAETRAALASAALRLAVELGPNRVTVDEIAAAAGVSPRTFFNYFASKEEAILTMPPSAGSKRLVERLAARPRDEAPLEALRAAMQALSGSLQGDPDEWIARNHLVRDYPSLAARYAARLAEVEHELVLAIAERTGLDPDRDLYPALLVGATLAASRVAVTFWQEHGPSTSLSALFDEAFDQLSAGLASADPRTTMQRTPTARTRRSP